MGLILFAINCLAAVMSGSPLFLSPGSRVIAHWPSLPAKLSGKVIGIEHGKYYVEYDDGDKHHNTIDQLRILKPPLYFGRQMLCTSLNK